LIFVESRLLHTTRDKVDVDERHWSNAVQVFTDGSMCNGSVGCGGCAAVLIPPHQEEERISTCPVGRNVEAITCEIHGVVLTIKLAAQRYMLSGTVRKTAEQLTV